MSGKRPLVVLFDLGGVLLGSIQTLFRSLEKTVGLPGGFFQKVIKYGGSDGPFSKGMTGQIGLTQLIADFEDDCKKFSSTSNIPLPENFSLSESFVKTMAKSDLSVPFLKAAMLLKKNGFRIAVLTNNWIDDTPSRHQTGFVFCLLRKYFDKVIESCRIGLQKPDPKIYEYALRELNVTPEEVIYLDDIGTYLKPAEKMGMTTILVKEADSALKQLQDLTGVQLLDQEEYLPSACEPQDVAHGYVKIKPDTELHFVEMGSGPVICLCHGFPESWFSWRFQIPALADAGFRVIALQMKGYGDSVGPPDAEAYSQEEICKDLVIFLDKMSIVQATFIGHDWGGATVWNMALFYPERVKAVAGINTPYTPSKAGVDCVKTMEAIPIFDYQFYFQELGVAEAELEKDIIRTLKIVIRSSRKEDEIEGLSLSTAGVRKRGGLFVGLPEDPPPSSLLPEPVLQYYVQQYQKSGFRGPLNWYRNMERNWSWGASAQGRKIRVPALMVTAGKDKVLHPGMSKHMENWIPQLTRGHIEDCGHFTQIERPAALNKILIEWLEDVHKNASLQTTAKL
ncbi:bifunctional epoxide hydrolase 2 [Pseudonaja textilis]|uniref:bifunctional epoxide hydrolase 2 n=1 Tax=Pseudonaja textilis TaxID=8673 RepID=UPI000EA8BB84|nr:bifunctional epoxide hydrolase 2 [Pseudonaja textilis]